MNAPTPKYYRKFGPVTVTTGNNVKVIYPEQYLRIRKDTKDVLLDEEGRTIVQNTKRDKKNAI